jgi:hypothetical protein
VKGKVTPLYVHRCLSNPINRETNRIRTIDEFWQINDHARGSLSSANSIELELNFPKELYRSLQLEHVREIANRSVAGCNEV